MKKEMPREGKKYKKKDIKKELKKFLTFKNICRVVSASLFLYVFAKLLVLILGLVSSLLLLLLEIIGLPEAAFTNKFVLMLILFAWIMYILIKTMWRMALRVYGLASSNFSPYQR